jgi:hypothetical protein
VHSGGGIEFGPDGMLYIGMGDTGPQGDPEGHGQNLGLPLGKMLRIDVDHGTPYAIPGDNPFVGRPGLDEIYAYGFRNPYRFSFDDASGGTGMLLVQDAGQELWEEVSLVVKGGNYGWNVKEGTHCFDAESDGMIIPPTCPTVDPTTGEPLRNPVIEFANSKNPVVPGLALTVVGGNVYRGHEVPWLKGSYVFAGATAPGLGGRLFASTPQGAGLWPMAELLINGTDRLGHVVKGFGQDARGEVYVMASIALGPTGTTGKVFKLVQPAR